MQRSSVQFRSLEGRSQDSVFYHAGELCISSPLSSIKPERRVISWMGYGADESLHADSVIHTKQNPRPLSLHDSCSSTCNSAKCQPIVVHEAMTSAPPLHTPQGLLPEAEVFDLNLEFLAHRGPLRRMNILTWRGYSVRMCAIVGRKGPVVGCAPMAVVRKKTYINDLG